MSIIIRHNDCAFIDSKPYDLGAVTSPLDGIDISSIEFNYCAVTDSQTVFSAGVSATDSITYLNNDFSWDQDSKVFPTFANIDKESIRFSEYGLSSTSVDRASSWVTNDINTGFYRDSRLGPGAWFFNLTGHIGAFYFGPISGAHVTPEPLEITLELLEPTIIIGDVITVTPEPLNIFLELLDPTIYSYEDVVVDFVGSPLKGSSPLDVDFTATVNLLSETLQNYNITSYKWYFDYDISAATSATTDIPTTSHTFSGYSGKTFSINLDVVLTSKSTSATITRSKYKSNYITLCGMQQPVRFGTDRLIDLKGYLSDYHQETDIYNFIKMFEDYLNTMYEGNKSYEYSEEDL